MRRSGEHTRGLLVALVCLLALAAAVACAGTGPGTGAGERPRQPGATATTAEPADPADPAEPSEPVAKDSGAVTLAFAGDVHFQLHLAELLDRPRQGLGAIGRVLGDADLTMVNLESSISSGGTPDPKELEDPANRYWFRTAPEALDVLAAAGVDVVTMANNHAGDYGREGLDQTLRAARRSPIPVVGVGRDRDAAFAPYTVTVRGTDIAFLAGDSSPREGSSGVWEAGPDNPGVAAARTARPRALLSAVRRAGRTADVVVVFLHWGAEGLSCPTPEQTGLAESLAAAGADVVTGSHSHELQGSGWLGKTYVNYGLGNFVWYHDHQPESGVLRLRVDDGRVVGDEWLPAMIPPGGVPVPLEGEQARAAVVDWRRLNACTDLAAPSPTGFTARIRRIGAELRARMDDSHGPGCPAELADLRHLTMTYVGFDGRDHTGEMVVAARHAADVVRVFGKLYDARFPIRRMRLVDAYGGDDDRSMVHNNTSAYNCRPVAGSSAWSDHAFGTAIDINPVQNPFLSGSGIAPPAGRRLAGIDRSPGAEAPRGTIREGDVVVRAFARIGWQWGGRWENTPDYQHFFAGPAGGRR